MKKPDRHKKKQGNFIIIPIKCLGWYTYDVHEIVQFSRPPTTLVHQRPKFFHPLSLTLDVQFQTNPPPSSNDNQSVKRKNNPRMKIMIPSPSFRSAFVFRINSLILPGFPLAFFHLAEASLSAFLWLYTFVCAVAQKLLRNVFYNYSHF